MSAADDAYHAAQAEIARVKAEGEDELRLDARPYRALEVLPPEIAELDGLRRLEFDNTQVTDLTPIAGMHSLQRLYLTDTQVTDLSPIAGMPSLQTLDLRNTQVTDLSPIAGMQTLQVLALSGTQVADLRPVLTLTALGESEVFDGLHFRDCAATKADPELKRLSEIDDKEQRLTETLAYLRRLPPWPEPLQDQQGAEAGRADDKNIEQESPKAQAAQGQIAFLLSHAATSAVQADHLADQIRYALRDVPAMPGTNQLPEALQAAADVATVLDRVGKTVASPVTGKTEQALRAEIADLETQVEALTQALADETKAKEAAEALAKANGVWGSMKKGAGMAAGATGVAAVALCVPSAAVYFLGAEHPVVQAFLTTVGRLPK